jgi:predicted  nucleic acid-binding Zn-ribbon protein
MWRCGACGYVWDNEEPPGDCPKCGASKGKFGKIEDKMMEMVERSRFTNNLLMNLFTLLEQAMDVAEDGIDDNLDPGCVKIFEKTLAETEILQQSIKAELQSHMGKGKWG